VIRASASSAAGSERGIRTIVLDDILHRLAAGLLVFWSLASLGTATIGLDARPAAF
jgi:hypothetical protein